MEYGSRKQVRRIVFTLSHDYILYMIPKIIKMNNLKCLPATGIYSTNI